MALVLCALACASWAADADARRRHHPAPDRVQRGIASVYAPHFTGRAMADGTRFDPRSNAAASRSLPLGSAAVVTNLRTGRSTVVRVRDRGPHGRGRILDISPGSARALGIPENGVARVSVAPLPGAPVAVARHGRNR